MRHLGYSAIFSIFLSHAAFANKVELWPNPEPTESYDSVQYDETHELVPNAKALIMQCLETHKSANDCTTIVHRGVSCGAQVHLGACNFQETIVWSEIGWEYYNKEKLKRPQFAEDLEAAQAAWFDYTQKRCKHESESSSYDDFPLPHPPWLDWRDYTNCVLQETAHRVIYLRTQSSY